jgi:hypothetical protein
VAALSGFAPAQSNSPVTIGHSETLFTVLAAINNCGYDAELDSSDPLRTEIRDQIGHNVANSDQAKAVADALCSFYRDHQQPDATHTLSQYVSLALYLGPPPTFTPKVKEADLPPDASGVLGLVPLLARFYAQAGTHQIWESHAQAYAAFGARYHDALEKMIRDTELYLRLPSGSYMGRTFTIYLEPMGAPSDVNARSYANNYYIVISPGTKNALKIAQVHHAYLHYLIDPLVGMYAASLSPLTPVLDAVKLAPMSETFKSDPVLLVTECVIRAIEARTAMGGKTPVADQERAVQQSMSEGFALTQYFYERLKDFEKGDVGFKNYLPGMLGRIDVHKEEKNAEQIQFASAADPELLQLARPKSGHLLINAQERLQAGDPEEAEKLAKEALAEKSEDPGRAYFILAQVSSINRNVNGARDYFGQAINATDDPKVVAWSHIYLGRIFDLQDDNENGPDRAEAVLHYKAALEASAGLPTAKAAAEDGLQKPYQSRKPTDKVPASNEEQPK